MQFIIRFDDVCPVMSWEKFSRFEDFFDRNPNIKPLLGVVPDNRDPMLAVSSARHDFWDRVRYWSTVGWSIAQHGHTHEYTRDDAGMLGIGESSEFAGLPYDIQFRKIEHGKRILKREGVWQPYFMAPAHSFDANTLLALRQLDFAALTDGYGLYPYRFHGLIAVPQLFSTPITFGFGVYTICVHVNTMSDIQIARMLRFLEVNSSRFISFPEALSKCRDGILARGLQLATEGVVKSVRAVRFAWEK
jgi:predicted deacetylase